MKLERLFDRLVPSAHAEGDWERVLADARRRSRPVRVLRFAVPAATAAVVALALAWPFQSESPTVLARALAAIGDGPVIHIVTRGESGGSLVDLSTGGVTPLFAESEIWYDRDRGVHSVARFGGRVTSDRVRPPGMVPAREVDRYVSLVNRYRDELRSGKARVVARGRVNGRPVHWIRLEGERFPEGGDGHYHLLAQEVAVDRDTYEPVYMRFTRDGRPWTMGTGELFLQLETLAAGEGDFDPDQGAPSQRAIYAGAERGRDLRRSALGGLFGRPAIWLGPAFGGKQLAETRELIFKHKEQKNDPWQTVRGATLFYGQLRPKRFGVRLRDDTKPYILLTEAKTISPIWRAALYGTDIPDGSVQIDASRAGFLRTNGVYVSINARRMRDVIEAAAALRPFGAEAPPASGLDFEQIAREVDARTAHRVVATGASPVRPRPLVKRGAKVAQSGSGDGISVRIYRSGAAVFDTAGMSSGLRKRLPARISVGCLKVTGPAGSIGGVLVPFGRRITILLRGHVRRGRPARPIAPPFDACELGIGLGRNWLPRFDWHGGAEIPLTERGRRFFEERAAARELSTFARVGPMRRARDAMKRGAQAPPATSLADPNGRIVVESVGNRITLSLTASTGRRFFLEIVRGRIGRTNIGRFAFVR